MKFGVPLNMPQGLTLPPALAPGAPFSSFIDGNGTTWIAKGGVNGGAWSQARDTLQAKLYRSTLITVNTPATPFPFDAVVRDTWGMFNGASPFGFIVPLSGLYQVCGQMNCNVTATPGFINGHINVAGVSQQYVSTNPGAGGTFSVSFSAPVTVVAGNTVSMSFATSGSFSTIGTTQDGTWVSINYLGTG